jgi:hypothetical protein
MERVIFGQATSRNLRIASRMISLSVGPSLSQRTRGEEDDLMRRLLTLVLATALVVVMPAAAMAAVEKQVNELEDVFEDPLGAELCGVDEFLVHESGVERVTEFFNKDGDLVKVHVNVTGSTEITGDGELLAWENFAFMLIIDFEEGTATQNGNVFNIHVTGEGNVVNDSGQIIFSLEDDSLVDVKDPHEAFFTPPPVLICEALTS